MLLIVFPCGRWLALELPVSWCPKFVAAVTVHVAAVTVHIAGNGARELDPERARGAGEVHKTNAGVQA